MKFVDDDDDDDSSRVSCVELSLHQYITAADAEYWYACSSGTRSVLVTCAAAWLIHSLLSWNINRQPRCYCSKLLFVLRPTDEW